MTLPILILTAIALSMDAFAVSIACGISGAVSNIKDKFKIAVSFGVFQGVMPMIGFFLASTFSSQIKSIDHWVAFILLSIIGINMLRESRKCDVIKKQTINFKTILFLSVATSIDAMATGVSFAFLNINIIEASIYISIITFVFSLIGGFFGHSLGCKYKQKAELFGGLILILIGLKILIEHLFFM